jgi:predicted Fe-Mo cluster-binding NifX family protein
MRIAISIKGNSITSQFDPRFGRAANFVIADDETEAWDCYANPASSAAGGAGVQAAQFLAGQGARAAISGDFGPNAFDALSAAGIQMIRAEDRPGLTAQALLAEFREGRLRPVTAPGDGPRRRRSGHGRRRR